jgi:predicted TPR repeat methyltransferase
VERVLASRGFRDVRIQADTLRREAGQAVAGWVVLAQRQS